MNNQSLSKRWLNPAWSIAVGLGVALAGGVMVYELMPPPAPKSELVAPSGPLQVVALGRLEPASEVLNLTAPLALEGDRVPAAQTAPFSRILNPVYPLPNSET